MGGGGDSNTACIFKLVPALQDPGLISPGELEAQDHPHMYRGWEGLKYRDRNLIVPWTALAKVLKVRAPRTLAYSPAVPDYAQTNCVPQEYAKVEAGGGMAAYRRRLNAGETVHFVA